MALKIYNSLSQQIEFIKNPTQGALTAYCCGVTVYDHCHLGHARMFIVYDLLVRIAKALGYDVKAARNITDVDDKIIKKAHEEGCSCTTITARYIASTEAVISELNCLPLSYAPRATQSIEAMISMIQTLIQKGHAYVRDQEVLFHVPSFSSYGRLSKQTLDELNHGARVETSYIKKHPADFTLWKPSKEGEPAWSSPWGLGRPGWHIECSAMIHDIFQDSIDIHLGGMDLKFPHHENEIAQSECCFDKQLASCWMHVGFVTCKEEKMSKSLNNFQYVHDVLKQVNPDVMRYLYLSTHYRQPLEFSDDKIDFARRNIEKIKHAFAGVPLVALQSDHHLISPILDALSHDMNTPEALAIFYQSLKSAHTEEEKAQLFAFVNAVFGLTLASADCSQEDMPQLIKQILQHRQEARLNKDFKESDRLRDELKLQGYEVLDTKEGQQVRMI